MITLRKKKLLIEKNGAKVYPRFIIDAFLMFRKVKDVKACRFFKEYRRNIY